MINIDEYQKYKDVINLLKEKISSNEKLIKEKSEEISKTFNSFFNPKDDSSRDMTGNQMIDYINYDRSINNMASRQLNRYMMMLNKPYFARVDFKNNWGEQPYYFGIETLINNNEVIINDWRSPIANLYYEGNHGPSSYDSPSGLIKGNITLKRQYKFDDGNLVCYVDMGMNINDELLLDILGKNNDVIMRNIVSTIQKEQNQAIRYIGDNDLLVLGVAGSGKTSIALHRIAYLVYKDSIKYNSNKICFITPNELFFKYIDNVLPELGEENAVNMTMNDIAKTILKIDLYRNKLKLENKIDYIEKVVTNKINIQTDIFFDKLNSFLDNKMIELFTNKIGLKIGNLTFSSELFKELYFNKFKRRNYTERRKFIKEYLKDRVSNEKKLTKNDIETIDAFINKLLPEINFFNIYSEFLKSINYEDISVRKNTIAYQHIFPLCYVKIYFRGCKLFDKYNHLLIDEYQDLNIIERSVIQKVFNCNKTLVGDINQKLFSQDYSQLYSNYKVVELNNSYRSTIEIFNFLEKIIKSKGINGVKRHGKEVEVRTFSSNTEEKEYLNKIIKEYKGKSLAIICKTRKQASKLYLELSNFDNIYLLSNKNTALKRGIVIGEISLVKGLEFDKVIVYDASKNNYNSEIDRNYFYIACSRSINELTILSCKDITHFVEESYEKIIEQQ